VAATSATTRSGASVYRPELAVDDRQWYSQRCQSKGHCVSATPHRRKDRTHVSHGREGGENMGAGCGEVVISRACASCAMLSCSILARMASRGAASRAHSTRMHWIAALMRPGGSTGAITCSLSAQHCFFAVSWRRLSLANACSGNAESAITAVRSAANANFADAAVAVCSADSWQSHLHASSSNAFSCVVALLQCSLFALSQYRSLASVSWQSPLSRMVALSSATSAAVRGGGK
jgi:hypothetical protein